MCIKKTVKEISGYVLSYIKPLGFSGASFAVYQLPQPYQSPSIIYVLTDLLKLLVPLAALIYTVANTYFLIKKNRQGK